MNSQVGVKRHRQSRSVVMSAICNVSTATLTGDASYRNVDRPLRIHYGDRMVGLFCGALIIGFAPILIKAVDLNPTVIGFYRCAIAAVLLLPWTLRALLLRGHLVSEVRSQDPAQRPAQGESGRVIFGLALAGLILAGDFYIWNRSVVVAGAGIATILANTSVFHLTLFAYLFGRSVISRRFVGAVVLAICGVLLLVGLERPVGALPEYWWGVAWGLTTGVIYALFLFVLRRARAVAAGSIFSTIGILSLVAACFLWLFSLADGANLRPTSSDLLWLFLLAVGPQVIGWSLITRNLPKVPIAIAGLILLTQPVAATLLGAAIYREALAPLQITGAIITLVAIYLGSSVRAASPASATAEKRCA